MKLNVFAFSVTCVAEGGGIFYLILCRIDPVEQAQDERNYFEGQVELFDEPLDKTSEMQSRQEGYLLFQQSIGQPRHLSFDMGVLRYTLSRLLTSSCV